MSSEDRDTQEPSDCTPNTPGDTPTRATPIDLREAYPARTTPEPPAADPPAAELRDAGDVSDSARQPAPEEIPPTPAGDRSLTPAADAQAAPAEDSPASPEDGEIPARLWPVGAIPGPHGTDGPPMEQSTALGLVLRARNIWWNHFWLFVPMGLLPQIPLLVSPLSLEEPTIGGYFSLLFALLLLVLTTAAMILAVAHVCVYGRVRLLKCLADASQIALPMLLVQIIIGFALFSSFILIVVLIGLPLLLYFLVTLFFAPHAVAIERYNPLMALGRSRWLVRGHLLRALYIGVVFVVLVVLLHIVLVGPFLLLAWGNDMTTNVVFALAAAFATPYLTIGGTLTYFDLRIRHEGYDLDLLKDEIERDSPPS